jgi:hypothetical protein
MDLKISYMESGMVGIDIEAGYKMKRQTTHSPQRFHQHIY